MSDEFLVRLTAMRDEAKAAYDKAKAKHSYASTAMDAAWERLTAVEQVIAMHAAPTKKRTGRRAQNAENAEAILDIVRGANSVGLLSGQIVASLKERGIDLSVTSTGMFLSKLKAAGSVEQVGRNWRIPSKKQEPASAETPAGPESRSAPNGAGHVEDPVRDIL